MVGRIKRVVSVALSATVVSLAVVTACGGQSRQHEPDDGGPGATGGLAATGGSSATGGAGGSGGTGVKGGCLYEGAFYRVTAIFPATDGCNTCKCESTDRVVCTEKACLGCEELPERFDNALVEAKHCDPRLSSVVQCTVSTPSALQCGCPTYVNDDTELQELATEFQAQACFGPVLCGSCPEPPVAGRCSEDYVCVDR
jgi:hypothetical protein